MFLTYRCPKCNEVLDLSFGELEEAKLIIKRRECERCKTGVDFYLMADTDVSPGHTSWLKSLNDPSKLK